MPSPPSDLKKCECGLTYVVGLPDEEATHNQWHEEHSLGPNVPEVQLLPTLVSRESLRLVVVDNSVEEPIRKAVAQVAVVAQRCMPEFKFGYYGTVLDEDRSLCALIDGTRIVGMAITSFDEHLRQFSWTPEGEIQPSETNFTLFSGPKISRIWIASSYRRRGLAKWIIEKTGNHLGCDAPSLGWEMPLTESGKSLAKSICAEEFLGCGDFHSS